MIKSILLAATAGAVMAGGIIPAASNEKERQFFSSIEGRWSGPGEIVAGKYKGTRFVCNFTGSTPEAKLGMSLDGGCRVGLFTQNMSASVEKVNAGYRGSFMDGAAGKGLDITAGSISGNKATLALKRSKLDGAMQARMADSDTMNVTVSVKVEDQMVPVIGIKLKRLDEGAVGAIASE
jgi:hypothetical protein